MRIEEAETADGSTRAKLTSADLATMETERRQMGIRLAAAIAAATAGVLALGRLQLATGEHRLARDVEERATAAELLDRYSRAVEQLGHNASSVRIGALYALHDLAAVSAPQRQQIYDVICAYVRDHSRRLDKRTGQWVNVDGDAVDYRTAIDLVVRACSTDWQLDLGLRGAVLAGTDLRNRPIARLDLSDATITGVKFGGAFGRLDRVCFDHATLRGVDFVEARLDDVTFTRQAELATVNFSDCRLNNVSFDGLLRSVDFDRHEGTHGHSQLTGVEFRGLLHTVQFGRAELEDVRFVDAVVHHVRLDNVRGQASFGVDRRFITDRTVRPTDLIDVTFDINFQDPSSGGGFPHGWAGFPYGAFGSNPDVRMRHVALPDNFWWPLLEQPANIYSRDGLWYTVEEPARPDDTTDPSPPTTEAER